MPLSRPVFLSRPSSHRAPFSPSGSPYLHTTCLDLLGLKPLSEMCSSTQTSQWGLLYVCPRLCLVLGCFSLASLLHQSWAVLHHLALTRLPVVTAAAFLSSHLIVLLSSFSAAEQKRNCKNPGRSQLNQKGTADGAVPTFCWQWLEPPVPRGAKKKLSEQPPCLLAGHS